MLKEEIAKHHPPGSRLPSESHLASHFDVSLLTLREAMNSLCQEGLVERRQGSGTYVKPGAPKAVGVLLDHDIGLSRYSFYYRRVFQQVRRDLTEAGYLARGYVGFKPFTAGRDPGVSCPEFIADLHAGRLSGVVVVSGALDADMVTDLKRRQIPVWGGEATSGDAPRRLPALIRAGVQHLVAHGRRRLAFAGWSQAGTTPDGRTAELFRLTLAGHGIPFQPHWVRDDLHPAWAGTGWEAFREIWTAREKPDGILIADDLLAADAARAIHEFHIRVPEQLMVVSHANKGSDIYLPFPVTLLCTDPDADAHVLSAAMLRLLRGEPAPKVDDTINFAVEAPLEPTGSADKSFDATTGFQNRGTHARIAQ